MLLISILPNDNEHCVTFFINWITLFNNYIKCTISFDRDVMEYRIKSGGINGGINGGIKPSDKKVLSHILTSPDDTAAQIAEKCDIGKRTVERSLAFLQEKGMIERIGNKRNGRWIVIK